MNCVHKSTTKIMKRKDVEGLLRLYPNTLIPSENGVRR